MWDGSPDNLDELKAYYKGMYRDVTVEDMEAFEVSNAALCSAAQYWPACLSLSPLRQASIDVTHNVCIGGVDRMGSNPLAQICWPCSLNCGPENIDSTG